MTRSRLGAGDLLPQWSSGDGELAAGGPASREGFARDLARFEAPGINTLIAGATNMVLAEARGANLLDTDGKVTIDLISGFGAALLGHRNPRVVEAIKQQADLLVHGLGDVYANPARIELARALSRRAPGPNTQVYFAVSGSDAVEIALKTAVLHTGRDRVIAFDPGYHGLTLGALQATSRPAFREPFTAHAGQHITRLPFGCDPGRIAQELSSNDVAAILFEPIVGREGVLFPPDGWIAALLKSARETNTVSIADEIFTGMRRCGPWFAHSPDENSDGAPATDHVARDCADLICCGKALGGGMPIGAVLGPTEFFERWDTGGEALHTGTFVGHPLACAAALAVLAELEQPWVDERLGAVEAAFDELASAAQNYGSLSVRGQGALWAIQCATRAQARDLVDGARAGGLVLLAGGPDAQVVQVVPPLAITDQQLGYVVDTLTGLFPSLSTCPNS